MYYWNWLRMKTFSNIAGTLSDSFKIGKGGFEILQGTDVPTGNIAPVGSVYIRTLNESTGIYQHMSEGVWEKLGLNTVSIYRQSFVDGDLVSGQIDITHNLGERYVHVTLYDGNGARVPTEQLNVMSISDTTFTMNLSSLGTIEGTWNVVVTG